MTIAARESLDRGDPSNPFSLEMNLDDYWGLIRKYRVLILLICGISVGATAGRSLLAPQMYSATTVLFPQGPMELGHGLGDAGGSDLRRALGVTGLAHFYAGLLDTHTVLDAVIERLDLATAYGEASTARTRRTLRSNTTVDASGDGTVSIAVKDRDPRRAAAIANAYVEELNRQNRVLYAGQASNKRLFIENRLQEVQQELGQAEKLSPHEVATKEMILELLTREYEIARIDEAKELPSIRILDIAVPTDERLSRGTVKKTVLAGGLSLVSSLFLAHLLEHGRRRRAVSRASP